MSSTAAWDAEENCAEGRRVSGELMYILQGGQLPHASPKSPILGRSLATVPSTPPRVSPPSGRAGYGGTDVGGACGQCTPWEVCGHCTRAQGYRSSVGQRPGGEWDSDSGGDTAGNTPAAFNEAQGLGLSRGGAFHGSLPNEPYPMPMIPRDAPKRAKVNTPPQPALGGLQGSLVFAPLGTSPRPILSPHGGGRTIPKSVPVTHPQPNSLVGFAPSSPIRSPPTEDAQKLFLLSPVRNGTADFRAELPAQGRGLAQRPKPLKLASQQQLSVDTKLVSHLTADLRMTARELREECGRSPETVPRAHM